MGHRLSKIYTQTGDDGSTALADGSRLGKDSARIEAIGDVDELNSVIAMVLVHQTTAAIHHCLTEIQQELFDLGAELSRSDQPLISFSNIEGLEHTLDSLNASLPPLQEFILPGGGQAAAVCHLARAVCRRAERSVVALARSEEVNKPVPAYLNRLSDLLFVLCRTLAREAGSAEVYWRSPRRLGTSP
ncbi:MAG: cob(I)yrinic acid a,c-diamide adenosyltransferase [Pseudomonadota bacterium]